jgi:hypothetical protein
LSATTTCRVRPQGPDSTFDDTARFSPSSLGSGPAIIGIAWRAAAGAGKTLRQRGLRQTGRCYIIGAPKWELKKLWKIAGYASGYDNRTSLILFRKPGVNALVQCSILYDVTQSPHHRQLLRAAVWPRAALWQSSAAVDVIRVQRRA